MRGSSASRQRITLDLSKQRCKSEAYMDPSSLPNVVEELRNTLPALIEEASQRKSSQPEIPSDFAGWRPYVPLDKKSAPYLPPTPWRNVDLLGISAAGTLVIIAFRWSPNEQLFAHVTDVSTWDMPETAALEIELRMTRMLASSEFPHIPKFMTAGNVTLVTGG